MMKMKKRSGFSFLSVAILFLLKINIYALPDLIVESINSPTTAIAGSTINATVTFKNIGSDLTRGSYVICRLIISQDIDINLGDLYYVNINVPNEYLKAGQSRTESFSFPLPATLIGQYYAGAYVDAYIDPATNQSFHEESNENNNAYYNPVPLIISSSTLPCPVGLSISQVPNGFRLSWAPVTGSTNYKIYWGNDNSVGEIYHAGILETSSTIFDHTGLDNGWSYYYRIKACDAGNCSSLSPIVNSTYSAVNQNLQAPQNVAPIFNNLSSSVTVSWQIVQNATSYRIYHNIMPGMSQTGSLLYETTLTTYDHLVLKDGACHYYSIIAVSSNSISGYSTEVGICTPNTVNINPIVNVNPSTGLQGTTFQEPGTGFSPNSLVTLMFNGPDGNTSTTEYTDMNGNYSHLWLCNACTPGSYTYQARDEKTGLLSNIATFEITRASLDDIFRLSGTVVVTSLPAEANNSTNPMNAGGNIAVYEINGSNEGNSGSISSNGSYSVPLFPGTYRISGNRTYNFPLAAGPYLSLTYDFSEPGNITINADKQLNISRPAYSITGKITDSRNNGLPNLSIECHTNAWDCHVYTSTDANGNYCLYVKPGSSKITINPSSPSRFVKTEVQVSINDANIEKDIILEEQFLLTGNVQITGLPPLAYSSTSPMTSGQVWAGSSTGNIDNNGNYSVTLPAGTYQVSGNRMYNFPLAAGPYLSLTYDYREPDNILINADKQLNISRPAYAITGKITDSRDNGLPNLSIECHTNAWDCHVYTSTDANGIYCLYVKPGASNITINPSSPSRFVKTEVPVSINDANIVKDIVLEEQFLLTGNVQITGLPPLAYSSTSPMTSGQVWAGSSTGNIDNNGNYSVTLPAGTYQVSGNRMYNFPLAAGPYLSLTYDYRESENILINADKQLNISRPAYSITGKITDSRDNGLPNLSIECHSNLWDCHVYTSTDANGTFCLYVKPGTYQIRLNGNQQFPPFTIKNIPVSQNTIRNIPISAMGEDFDHDGIPDITDTDDDNDGMPDEWEYQYGLNPFLNDANSDLDGDGVTNLQEYRNGTDPTVANIKPNSPPSKTIIIAPKNDAAVDPVVDQLYWTPSSDIDGDKITYCVVINKDAEPVDIPIYKGCDQKIFQTQNSMSLSAIIELEYGQRYWWAVWAKDEKGVWSEASEWVSFITGNKNTPPRILNTRIDPVFSSNSYAVRFECPAEDADGDKISYYWDFDGDGRSDKSGSDGTIEHVYDASKSDAYGNVAIDPQCTIVETKSDGSITFQTVRFYSAEMPYDFNKDGKKDYFKSNKLPFDSDNDGLPDAWEKNGFDFDRDGIGETELRVPGSSEKAEIGKKDIFVWIDHVRKEIALPTDPSPLLKSGGWEIVNCEPEAASIKLVKDAFASRNIALHVAFGGDDHTIQRDLASYDSLFNIHMKGLPKEKAIHFEKKYRHFFRYVLFTDSIFDNTNLLYNDTQNWSQLDLQGYGLLPNGIDFGAFKCLCEHQVVLVDPTREKKNTAFTVAGLLMHELGHSLGLLHGGGDNPNGKPNHISVMNYAYLRNGGIVYKTQSGHETELDYSIGGLYRLDENYLVDKDGVGCPNPTGYSSPFLPLGPLHNIFAYQVPYAKKTFYVGDPINWNMKNGTNDISQSINVNEDVDKCQNPPQPIYSTLSTCNEWLMITGNNLRGSGEFWLIGKEPVTCQKYEHDYSPTFKKLDICPQSATNSEFPSQRVYPYKSISIIPYMQDGEAGQTSPSSSIVFAFIIKNMGIESDSLNLIATASDKVSMNDAGPSFRLEPGHSYFYQTKLNISGTAEPGTVEHATFTVISANSGFVRDAKTVEIHILGQPIIDSDEDNMSDIAEIQLGLDPNNPDTDGDGIYDGIEISNMASPEEGNNDGKIDALDSENYYGKDSDNDGIADHQEILWNLNPKNSDSDNDGIVDGLEIGILYANERPIDSDKDGVSDALEPSVDSYTPTNDSDNDGIPNNRDNCPTTYNPNQSDIDHDGTGDVCDPDIDGDGILNGVDSCPDTYNPDQADFDHDGIVDACDPDDDNDGVLDANDKCPQTAIGETVNTDGCSIKDICPCENNWKNHGAYVSCVSKTTNTFKKSGLITEQKKGEITSQAGQSDCGKKK